MVLLAATCEECRIKTNRFETNALNSMTWLLRIGLNVRNLGDKHTHIRHKVIGEDGEPVVQRSPLNEIPITGLLPAFKPARILRNTYSSSEVDDFELVLIGNPSRHSEFEHVHDLDIRSYARMLCKIAHCYCVRTLGVEGFIPCLTNIIRGHDQGWANFLGSDSQPFPKSKNDLHRVSVISNGKELITKVQLFSTVGAPVYHVITGHLEGDQLPHNKHV